MREEGEGERERERERENRTEQNRTEQNRTESRKNQRENPTLLATTSLPAQYKTKTRDKRRIKSGVEHIESSAITSTTTTHRGSHSNHHKMVSL